MLLSTDTPFRNVRYSHTCANAQQYTRIIRRPAVVHTSMYSTLYRITVTPVGDACHTKLREVIYNLQMCIRIIPGKVYNV